jgi:hypothetical protein
MQMYRLIQRIIILSFASLSLLGIILANEAEAKKPPLKVSLGLPSNVSAGQVFDITIKVTNQTASSVHVNKVAVGYALQALKIKGPYEVVFTPVDVPAYGTLNFTVPFRILEYNESGTVVGLAVFLANNAYTEDDLMGSAVGGVRVD